MNAYYYIISNHELEELGYEYVELFAADVPYYTKEIDAGYTIWCNVEKRTVSVDDWWPDGTAALIDYYLENRDNMKHSKTFGYDYLEVFYNFKTGELMEKPDIFELYDNLDKYEHFQTIVFRKESADKLVAELVRICGKDFYMKYTMNKYNI